MARNFQLPSGALTWIRDWVCVIILTPWSLWVVSLMLRAELPQFALSRLAD